MSEMHSFEDDSSRHWTACCECNREETAMIRINAPAVGDVQNGTDSVVFSGQRLLAER